VRATGSKSNQDSGSVEGLVQEALAALASDEVRSGLSHLAKKLARLRASEAQPRDIKCCRRRARRPGWVLDRSSRC